MCSRYKILFLMLITFGITIICTQNVFEDENDTDMDFNRHKFIEPQHIENGDKFEYNNTEYIFVYMKMTANVAKFVCKENYGANLAIVRDLDLAHFLAEALAETRLILDSLWLNAKKSVITDEWYWVRDNYSEKIAQDIVDNFTYNLEVQAHNRKCLTMGRLNHDLPQFRPLECNARRAPMCERPSHGRHDNNSTHSGWIKLGKRYYKIFKDTVDWNTAVVKCFDFDHDSTLAVVTNYYHSQQLGRYLLIGRPSLENAWIDAKYIGSNYQFEQENIILSNTSDKTGYPPWRDGKIQKSGGCVLLDRHVSNVTLFIEARCSRLRSYVCYKQESSESNFNDIIIGNHGYRLHYNRKDWYGALDFCKTTYANYSSYLSEVREKVQLYHLLYVMGENRSAVRHIWLGGYFNKTVDPPLWLWQSDLQTIATGGDALLNWVKNRTYEKSIEEDYVCLKMDRENHIVALNYGTACIAPLCFVCSFTAEELRRLEMDEAAHLNMEVNT